MIGKAVSHYKITEKLGEGGMGAVYLARDQQLDRTVALKFLPAAVSTDPGALSRFRREARSAARLKHPNIVTIYEFGEHEGVPFLVMEHVEGQTLAKMLESGALPAQGAVDIALQVCDGLAKAHEAGIVHRDIKPANIVVDADGRARILDFGLAKLEGATTLTAEDTTVGTVAYMSPEQASGRAVDARSDLFSLGAVLYEMLAGRRPFEADHAAAATYKILHEPHDALPAEVAQFDSVIARALAKDPASRFQSAAEFGNALRVISGHVPVTPPPARRRWKPIAAVSTGVVVVVAALFIMNPFKLEVTRHDVSAGESKLAVMYFDNMADPDDPKHHGEMMAELLMTGLSESEQLNVVSSQRLYDLLKILGKEGEKKVDRTTATEVATRARARWMMLGRILQTEPNFVVTSQIVDVASGDITASQRTQGGTGESLFSLVDRITARTLDELSVEKPGTSTRPVAEMSTASEEAYRYYLEGLKYERKQFVNEARESFQKALEVDSTFAMAAFRRGMLEHRDRRERRRLFQQAIRHADQASPREQLYLRSAEAAAEEDWSESVPALEAVLEKYPDDKFALEMLANIPGDPKESIEYTHRLLELDPAHTGALNGLAYAYSRVGDLEDALRTVERYAELVPDEPNPYDTGGDIYAVFGRFEDAIASYQKAIEIRPDFLNYGSVLKLGHVYANKGDYEQAEAQYQRLFESPDGRVRSRGRWLLVGLLQHRGRCAKALEEREVARRVDRMEGLITSDDDRRCDDQVGKAGFLVEIGDTAQARKLIEECAPESIDPIDDFWSWIDWSYYFARLGMGDQADRYLAQLRARADSLSTHERWVIDMTGARVAAARGNYDDAIARYDALWDGVVRKRDLNYWFHRFCFDFAEVGFEAGRWDDVIRVVEEALTSYSYGEWHGIREARFHYFLGVAYQEVGRDEQAIEQLEKLLTIWADADPGLVGLEDARTRLASLKQGG